MYLTTALPIDDLLSVLYCKKVITIREKKQIERGDLRENKVCYLLDDIISPALKVGHGLKFDMLVKEMESSKDTTANHLAKKLMQGNIHLAAYILVTMTKLCLPQYNIVQLLQLYLLRIGVDKQIAADKSSTD